MHFRVSSGCIVLVGPGGDITEIVAEAEDGPDEQSAILRTTLDVPAPVRDWARHLLATTPAMPSPEAANANSSSAGVVIGRRKAANNNSDKRAGPGGDRGG